MVVCDSNADKDTFQDRPVILIEVVSDGTSRVDQGEKADHYLTIVSLQAYVLLEPTPAARAFIRDDTGNFVESIYTQPDDIITIDALHVQLALHELYGNV